MVRREQHRSAAVVYSSGFRRRGGEISCANWGPRKARKTEDFNRNRILSPATTLKSQQGPTYHEKMKSILIYRDLKGISFSPFVSETLPVGHYLSASQKPETQISFESRYLLGKDLFSQNSLDSHHSIEIVHRDFGFIEHLPPVWILAFGAAAAGEAWPLNLTFCK